MSPIALPAPPTLDGRHLVATSKEWRIQPREIKDVTTLATGDRRESFTYAGAGKPLIKTKLDIAIEWEHLKDDAEYVEERMQLPGPHELALWRYEHRAFVGNGSRVEFTLPWLLAVDVLGDPPPGLAAARFEPKVKVGQDGSWLTYLSKDSGAYAGTPAAGEVWFLEGAATFKMLAPPAAGAYVFVHVVPMLSVVQAADQAEKRFANPHNEPRVLRLLEI